MEKKNYPPQAWARLDNAAKIFPPNSNRQDSNVFRFACELNETVDPSVLQPALDRTLEKFPLYRSILRRGLFWHYFEQTDMRPVVHQEDRPPCSRLYDPNIKRLLFDVSYYQNRINLEVFHALSDGTGALHFLRQLVYDYLVEKHEYDPNAVEKLAYDASFQQKQEDSFARYSKHNKKRSRPRIVAYQERYPTLPEYAIQIIEGHLSTAQTLAKARSFGVSLTVYFAATLLAAYADSLSARARKKPVVLAVPVDLRNFFGSETARNFFSLIYVRYTFSAEVIDFDDILASVHSQFAQELTQERLSQRIDELSQFEKNPFMRIVPLVLKNPALRLANYWVQLESTTTLSNIGRIDFPDFCAQYIERFDVFTSTEQTQLCLCSYRDQLTVSFSTSFLPTEIQKNFFRRLTQHGLNVRLCTTPRETP